VSVPADEPGGEVDRGEEGGGGEERLERGNARRIIAVGGGKGGVGKSLLAANVAIYLAQLGKRVVLLDADLGGANLHTFVGIDRPSVTLGDFFAKRIDRIERCVVETSVKNLGLVSAEGDPLWAVDPRPATKNRLLNQVRELEVDYLICDLPPGSGSIALDFFLVAQVGVLVVVPEPTSIENTFRFIKSAFLRRLRGLKGFEKLETDRAYEGGIPSPLDLYQATRESDPQLAEKVLDEIQRFRPRLVVNQTRARSDLDLGQQLRGAGRRRLGLAVDYLGYLESDDAVWLAVRKRRPLIVEHPEAKVTKNIERIVRRLLAVESEKAGPREVPLPTEEQNHYQVLELDPGATEEEIRRAHKRVRETYAGDSMVVCGLFSPERLEVVQERIEAAYDTLLDPEERKRYDLELFPEGVPPVRTAAAGPIAATAGAPRFDETPLQPPTPEPVVTSSTEFTGELLKRIREARSIDLADIAQRTKIGASHLRSIEDERWEALPAVVYLRGFLVEIARCLKLDPGQVSRTYLERFYRARPVREA
jgi:flagellar biosynthesis protein FlhG